MLMSSPSLSQVTEPTVAVTAAALQGKTRQGRTEPCVHSLLSQAASSVRAPVCALPPLWAAHLHSLSMGTRFASICLLAGSNPLLGLRPTNSSWLPFPFLVLFFFILALLSCFVGFLFCFNVCFKVKFQGEELKSTKPAQELISC